MSCSWWPSYRQGGRGSTEVPALEAERALSQILPDASLASSLAYAPVSEDNLDVHGPLPFLTPALP